MKKVSDRILLVVIAMFVLSSFSFVGCTKHPKSDQLQALDEQKNAALSAENTLEERKDEKRRLDGELDQKRKELQNAKDELETVKERLGQ